MINEFQGDYRFLSNFWPCQVWFNGLVFSSVEHAYVASKTKDPNKQREIQVMEKPGQVKRFGKTLSVRPDFDDIKTGIMRDLVYQKFAGNDLLKLKLLSTGDQELVEGNRWGDTFWGVCNGVGDNHLGRILMQVRTDLKNS